MAPPTDALRPTRHLFEDARLLVVEVRVDATAAAALLPPPLSPTDPPMATLFFADYPKTTFGSVYKEGGILLHAYDGDGPVMHCPWIVVDDDTALILGRELLGFPKKLAQIEFDDEADSISGVVRRKDIEVMRIEARLGSVESDPDPVFDKRVVNAMGSIVTGMKLMEAGTGERIKRARRATATLRLHSTRRDPLADLQAGEVMRARYVVLDYGAGGTTPRIVGDVDPAWAATSFFARAR